MQNQEKKLKNLEKYNNNWKKAFSEKNINNMEKYMKKIKKIKAEILPVENIIKDANTIENIHSLIENNGNNFDLNDEMLELAKLLS